MIFITNQFITVGGDVLDAPGKQKLILYCISYFVSARGVEDVAPYRFIQKDYCR